MAGDGSPRALAPLPHPMWQDRIVAAREHTVPWIQSHVPLSGATVLEYGCGQGAVTCALAPHVGRHIGLDIDPDALAMASGHVERLGVTNVELVHSPAEKINAVLEELLPDVDVVVLYAVLEHLTSNERLQVLTSIRDHLPAHATVVICETPSRLTPFDIHTAQMPFVHQLPVELAARYAAFSPRPDFAEAMAETGPPDGPGSRDAMARWGQGVSFHEFEVIFGDLAPLVVGGGFEELLYPIRPVREEEQELARRLAGWRPALHPAWARCWLDVILRPGGSASAAPAVRPWAMRTRQVESGVAMLPGPVLELAPRAAAHVRLPASAASIHVGARTDGPPGSRTVELIARGARHVLQLTPARDPAAPWHGTTQLPEPCDSFDLELPQGGNVTFVGYAPAA